MRPPPGLWRKCWSISKWNTRTLPWWSMKMVTWAQWYLEILLYEMVNVSLYSYVTLVLATRSCWPAWPIWRQHLRRRVQVTVPAGLHRSHTSFHQVLIQQLSFNYATDGQEAFWNWYDRAWNYLKSMPNLLWNLIALFCAQERIKRAGLLRVVIPGRVRVPIRLPPRVRCLRCRLQLDGKDKVSEALGEVVLQLPPGWRAQAGGSARRSLLPVISTL